MTGIVFIICNKDTITDVIKTANDHKSKYLFLKICCDLVSLTGYIWVRVLISFSKILLLIHVANEYTTRPVHEETAIEQFTPMNAMFCPQKC